MEANRDIIARLIERALEDGPFTIQQIAAEAGISYDSLYSWAKGRRVPRSENLHQLATGFERRADALRTLAQALRSAAEVS
jgi:hypothetical protein